MNTDYRTIVDLVDIDKEQLKGPGHTKLIEGLLDEGEPAFYKFRPTTSQSFGEDIKEVYAFSFIYKDKTYHTEGYVLIISITSSNELKVKELCKGINKNQLYKCIMILINDLKTNIRNKNTKLKLD